MSWRPSSKWESFPLWQGFSTLESLARDRLSPMSSVISSANNSRRAVLGVNSVVLANLRRDESKHFRLIWDPVSTQRSLSTNGVTLHEWILPPRLQDAFASMRLLQWTHWHFAMAASFLTEDRSFGRLGATGLQAGREASCRSCA